MQSAHVNSQYLSVFFVQCDTLQITKKYVNHDFAVSDCIKHAERICRLGKMLSLVNFDH